MLASGLTRWLSTSRSSPPRLKPKFDPWDPHGGRRVMTLPRFL